jgi:uridylate kinase
MSAQQAIYKRIIVKMSGEALNGNSGFGIDPDVIHRMANEITELHKLKVEVGLVIGGGNLFRGRELSEAGLGRITGDHMGMLATLMNALALRDIFERCGLSTRVMSAIPMSGIVDHYDRRKATHHLTQGRVVIFAAGTGNPLVTTDSAASLRSIEVEADVLLKATNVDGVYSADPAKHPEATLYKSLTYHEVLEQELGVMDLAAFCQCRDYNMPIRVFNVRKPGALVHVVTGANEGTIVQS